MASSAINLDIPLRSKAGKIPYSSHLIETNYYSSVLNSQNALVWNLWGSGFAFHDTAVQPAALGGTAGGIHQCPDPTYEYTSYSATFITDGTGAQHALNQEVQWARSSNALCQSQVQNGPASSGVSDNTGWTLYAPTTGNPVVYDIVGHQYTLPVAGGLSTMITDPDGATISWDGGASTDTLGATVLTLSKNTAGNPTSASYTDVSGNTQQYVVGYTSIPTLTNFGCSGIAEAGGTKSLPTSILTPTGASYTISYEPTPGNSGYYTGRISKIILPQNGSISYAYSGGNNGIYCPSETYPSEWNPYVPTITVTVNDNNGNSNVYTYVHSVPSGGNGCGVGVSKCVFTVTKTDPAGNATVYSFYGEFQTQAKSYQGAATGTPLTTVLTCYNGNTTSCTSPSTAPVLPVTQTDVYTSLGTSASNHVTTTYDAYGNVTSVVRYDYGATTPTLQTYTFFGQSWNGTSCTAYPAGTYIYNTPCYTHTENSSGTDVARTQITYSNTGHATSTVQWTGSTSLTSTATYNTNSTTAANGTIATATDANGIGVYTYTYNGTDGCNNVLPTSVTVTGSGLPSGGLITSTQWNCNGGVATQTADANTQPTLYTYTDPLWRITSITDPLENVTNYSYPTPTTFETVMNFGTISTSDTLITTDGLGRQIFSQTRQGQGSTTFDTVQTTYGWSSTGPFTTTSVPYSGTQAQSAPSGTGSTTTQDDAVSRPLSVSNTGGGLVSTTYSQNDVLSVLGPAPTGEHTKQTQTQYDGLGRVTSVCGIENSGGTACGQATGSSSGVVTTTAYASAAGSQTVTSTRASQSRSSVVDGLGRTTQGVTPEGGTWNYYYDSYSSCPTGYTGASGQLTAVKDPNGNLLCYGYDASNRVTGVNANGTTCRHFYYDNSTGYLGSVPSGYTLANNFGRMVEAATDSCQSTKTSATLITDEWMGDYDKDGRTLVALEMTPNSTQYYKSEMTYTGPALTAVNHASPSLATFTYGLDGEGRWNSLSDGGTTYVPSSGVTYNAAGQPTNISIGTGSDYDGYAYDKNTLLMTGWTFQVNSVQETAVITPNANNTIKSVAITDGFNANGTITYSYNSGLVSGTGYDDLGRLIGWSATGTGGTWSQAFSFDQYDNITKSGTGFTAWNPGYSATTNHYTCSGCTYDANGDVTNDGKNAYTWSAFSKIASVNLSGTGCSTSGDCIIYDAFGRAVEFDDGSTKTEIWYTPIGKHFLNGATSLYGYEAAPGGGTAFGASYVHEDWMGNGRIISTISSPTVTTDRAYAPYGEVFNIFGGTGQNENLFNGLDQGIFSGMYDTPNREMTAIQGRFMSPDPARSGWNQYGWPTNPNSESDPLGLSTQVNYEHLNALRNSLMLAKCNASTAYSGWVSNTNCDLSMNQACYLDGMQVPCQQAEALLGSGVAAICPDNDCGQIRQDPEGGQWEQLTGWQFENQAIYGGRDSNGDAIFTEQQNLVPIWDPIDDPTIAGGAANNGSWLQNAWNYLKKVPVNLTVIVPVLGIAGPAVTVTYLPQTNNLCVAPGLGASVGRNVSAGPLVLGNLANAQSITQGASISVGAQALPIAGAQATGNQNGILGGPTVGIPGGSVTATYGICF